MNSEAVRLIVHGQVQGVGYRYFCLQVANQLGVTGWAKNRSDGTVEIEACGTCRDLDSFVIKLREGPRFAEVSDIQTEAISCNSSNKTFEIR